MNWIQMEPVWVQGSPVTYDIGGHFKSERSPHDKRLLSDDEAILSAIRQFVMMDRHRH